MFIFSEISLNPIPEARIFSTCTFCRLFMQIPPQGGVAEKGSKCNRLIILPKIKKRALHKSRAVICEIVSVFDTFQILRDRSMRKPGRKWRRMSSLRSLTAGQSVRESGGEDSGDPTGEGGQGIPGKADIVVHTHCMQNFPITALLRIWPRRLKNCSVPRANKVLPFLLRPLNPRMQLPPIASTTRHSPLPQWP